VGRLAIRTGCTQGRAMNKMKRLCALEPADACIYVDGRSSAPKNEVWRACIPQVAGNHVLGTLREAAAKASC
jgi:hypothetical protein